MQLKSDFSKKSPPSFLLKNVACPCMDPRPKRAKIGLRALVIGVIVQYLCVNQSTQSNAKNIIK